MSYTWGDDTRAVVLGPAGRSIPVDLNNSDYAALVAAGVPIADHVPPAPTASDVQREYWRRLCIALDARDLAHAGFIRADDHVELQALLAVASPTPEQTTRIAELQARDIAVASLIDAYNAIPDNPPPADYADDTYWS